jgi:hypothetical protein
MTIKEGSTWIAKHAIGRKDPVRFTVRGVTDAGVYITSPECRTPGNLIKQGEFRKLYAELGSRCGTLTDVDGIWRDIG